MSLAAHVRTLGRGPGRSRSLTEDEAAEAIDRRGPSHDIL